MHLDGRQVLPVIGVLLLILVSRLVFWSDDLGGDPDAYRFGFNAFRMWEDHRYYYSRSPGYPLYDIVNTPLMVLGGGRLTNLATMAVSLVGLAALYRIFVHYRVRRPLLLLVLFAFVPVVWIASFSTMDYWWSLALILLAWERALAGKPYQSAVLAGLAVGMRLPAGVMILPLLGVIWNQRRDWAVTLKAGLVFLATALIAFSPMVLTYGLQHFNYVPYSHHVAQALYRAVRYTVGAPALILLGLALAGSWRQRGSQPAARKPDGREPSRLPVYAAAVLGLAMFLRLPAEPAYLMPVLPFALILLDRWVTPGWWWHLTALVALNNFVSVPAVDTAAWKEETQLAFVPARAGALVQHLREQRRFQRDLDRWLTVPLPLAPGQRPLILVGSHLDRIRFACRKQIRSVRRVGESPYDTYLLQVGDRWFSRAVSSWDLERLKADNYSIFYIQHAGYITGYTFNYNLAEYGAAALQE
ncbi:MAG: hypothetical protein C4524_05755 [Candidatus Zixiibacteriota bacterium]|nr:MAG: hypothetical protein C4524_05755 [candidate division Zixibacteria bacterium]